MAYGIYLVVDEKLHRGFRDPSGRFTLEQCNLAKANEADNLEELIEGDVLREGFHDLAKCEHCFPNEARPAEEAVPA